MERGYHYGEWQPLISASSLGDTGTGADGLNRFNAASATAFPVVSRQMDTLTQQTKELAALAQKVTLASAEPLKTGVTKAFGQAAWS